MFTYKNRGRISGPEFDFAEEHLTGHPVYVFVKSNYCGQLGLNLQSRLIMVSPRVDKIKNCESINSIFWLIWLNAYSN